MKFVFYFQLFFLCAFATPVLLVGQKDSLHIIKTVEVRANSIKENKVGAAARTWNKMGLQKSAATNVAELLSEDGEAYIKSYGAGSLATSTIRGGSAGHTLVLWNGMPIQSPMLGLLDLSLLPSQAVEEVVLQKGGNATLYGSGAIGGVIALNNRPDFNSKLNAEMQYAFGSFDYYSQQIKLSQGNAKFQSVSKFSNLRAENDFFYFIAPDFPKRQQSNAAIDQQNIQQDFYWRPNQKLHFSTHFWRQLSKREIPPTNVQSRSLAKQDDRTTRFLLQVKSIANKYALNAKLGFAKEHLNYFDEQIGLESLSRFINWNGELGAQWSFWDQHVLYAGINDIFTKVWTEGYENTKSEHNAAAFMALQFNFPKLKAKTSLRQNISQVGNNQTIPEIGLDYAVSPSILLKLKASKNFRLPTFNDRYWFPGGNEDLLPESGWSQEATIASNLTKNKTNFSASVTAFNRNIKNWILWTPTDGQGFWSAKNITEVWSRGLEPKIGIEQKMTGFRLKLNLQYNYIRSTNQFALSTPNIEKGRQLLYTPVHQTSASLALDFKEFDFSYRHAIYSKSLGVNEEIPKYHLGAVSLHYKKDNTTLFLNINNLYNKNYFIIERRPMPGTNFKLGLRLSLNQSIEQGL